MAQCYFAERMGNKVNNSILRIKEKIVLLKKKDI